MSPVMKGLSGLFAALALVSCTLDGPVRPADVQVPEVATPKTPLPVLASYRAARVDPSSVGNRHNAALDSILARGKRLRRAKGGSRLTREEVCGLFAETAASFMAPTELQTSRRDNRAERAPCDDRRLANAAALRLQTEPASGSQSPLAASASVDWIDSLWNDSAEWEGEDTFPSFDDDLDFLNDWEAHILQTLGGSASYAGFSASIESLVASAQLYDSVHVAMLAEMASLAVSSAGYWNANLADWIETFCPADGGGAGGGQGDARTASALGAVTEVCDGGLPQLQGGASGLEWGWEKVAFVAFADAKSPFLYLRESYQGFKALYDNWYQVARERPGYRVMIRVLQPSSKQVAKMLAKSLVRSSYVGIVGNAIYDSALAAFGASLGGV
jgi:hypothetical protein